MGRHGIETAGDGTAWRAIGAAATAAVVVALTRQVGLALLVGALDFALRTSFGYLRNRTAGAPPVVLWLTGLSGAGKSTVSAHMTAVLRATGAAVEQLDGDSIRHIFPNTGFSKAERDAHIRRVGYLASKLERHGVFVVVSLVSPYRESRDFVRGLCGNFVEVYLATPLAECERRDVKGLYAKARRGEIRNFTGIDDPYEPPLAPELVIDTTNLSVEAVGDRILGCIRARRSVQGSLEPRNAS